MTPAPPAGGVTTLPGGQAHMTLKYFFVGSVSQLSLSTQLSEHIYRIQTEPLFLFSCFRSGSVVAAEHPMAFMLPSVSLSEAGSETDSAMSCYR